MRIATVITLSNPVGGAQVYVRDLTEALIKNGHESEVFVGSEGILTDWLTERNIRHHVIPHLRHSISPFSDIRATKALTQMLADYHPDIVATNSSKAGIIGRLAARRLGIPSVYTVHGWSFLKSEGKLSAFAGWQAEKYCARFTKRIIAVSEFDRNLAIERKLCSPEKVVAIHNGIPDVSKEFFANPGEDAKTVEIVMVARFAAPKDHATLLTALSTLKDRQWRLSLVGDGPDELSVRSMVAALGLDDRVVFVGAVRSVLDLLADSHLFVMTSLSEGLPLSIMEAMRAGLPVISNRVAGIPEEILDGQNGYLVDVKEAEILADRLAMLIDDKDLRARMGQESRKLYLERFTSQRLIENTYRVFEQAVAER